MGREAMKWVKKNWCEAGTSGRLEQKYYESFQNLEEQDPGPGAYEV